MIMSLLLVLLLPVFSAPTAYLVGKKSAKTAANTVLLFSILDLFLLLTAIPDVLSGGRYTESYYWMPMLGSPLTLFVDGISLSMAAVTLLLIISSILFSINYMEDRKSLREYYALMGLLTVGLVGVFITSNLMVFYFCWEFMLIPTYFIIGGWGYRESYRAAFKFFIFTHAGAVAVLLGIGAVYMLTGDLDMFQARSLLATAPQDILTWIFIAFTLGFAVKMAIVPLHMWLPDAHAEAPAPMSALLSGVIIEAGAYAILRVALGTVFPSITSIPTSNQFLYALSIFGVISAFYGAFTALAENDIKRIVAYSSISHMGYALFGLSLFPFAEGMIGTVLHLVNHAASKGLLFLNAGAIMKQTNVRDINEMGGLASKMPLTAVSTAVSSFSVAGVPAFACFMSEFLIFMGGFRAGGADNFYYATTALMIVATVFSLAYVLRLFWKVFLETSKIEKVEKVPISMSISMIILSVTVIILGVWPGPIIELISTPLSS
ncbi:MAG: NADH-quinone oxidoreductase subunit M [Candidatus Bathyarchaeota archaeon]|nr:NADH-quinone oxidoreductase subunit M [Candidatus Bathyarchaeota archaeon]